MFLYLDSTKQRQVWTISPNQCKIKLKLQFFLFYFFLLSSMHHSNCSSLNRQNSFGIVFLFFFFLQQTYVHVYVQVRLVSLRASKINDILNYTTMENHKMIQNNTEFMSSLIWFAYKLWPHSHKLHIWLF